MGLSPHLKDAHTLGHVKILFNKLGGLGKQMTVAVSIAVFGYNTHKLFVSIHTKYIAPITFNFKPYLYVVKGNGAAQLCRFY